MITQLEPHKATLDELRSKGWRMDLACLWDSQWGDGGPTLSPSILKHLADLEIEIWFDLYLVKAYRFIQKLKGIKGVKAHN